MWCPDTDDLIEEIQRAARCFKRKFGVRPNTCRLNGSGILKEAKDIRIVPDATITPGHFLLCCEEVEK